MSRVQAGRARARLAIYFLGVGLTAVAVAVFGWRLLEEDRAQQRQQLGDRLESAADRVSAELLDELAEVRAHIGELARRDRAAGAAATAWANALPSNALVVAFGQDEVRAWPPGRLLFGPVDDTAGHMPAAAFAAGERLEFRDNDPSSAAAVFARQSESADADIRAGALLRLARTLRKAGRHDDALAAYDRLLDCDAVLIAGRPATLLALDGRLRTWQELGDTQAAEREAGLLRERLLHPEWRISRGTFEHYWSISGEAIKAIGDTPDAANADLLAGSLAVETLWTAWRAGRTSEDMAAVTSGRGPRVVGWMQDDDWMGLVAGPEFLDATLQARVAPLLDRYGAAFVLLDRQGQRLAGAEPITDAVSGPIARRTTAESGLPWMLQVFSADPDAELALLAGRRRLIALGLVVMAGLVVAGGVLSVQSVRRDLRVADLKSGLMAAVSHEFRTPLTLMRQTTEALADGRVQDEDTRRHYYRRQLRATARLQRLVEGMLDFGRVEAGAFQLVADDIDAREWLHNVVRLFNEESEGTSAPVQIDAGEMPVAIRADREALTRALWNLLDNAVKYSPAGSPVDVSLAADGSGLTIDVRDRGPGVAPGERERIFEKFARGRTTAGRATGTGLGLAMAREIARAHGGDVTVAARPDGGSIFTLSLPLGADR